MLRVSAALLLALCTSTARAHPAAAEPPIFPAGPCVTVADQSALTFLPIPYAVPYDDVEFTDGDIRLPDAKTHQFFAMRGALVWSTNAVELVPFEPNRGPETRLTLPLWISDDDVQRSAAAIEGSGTTFTSGEVPPEGVLDTNPSFAGYVVRIDGDDMRRPITFGAADGGGAWFLAGVAPGLYSIATYIFSPPFNGWAVRPGLVHVVSDAAAAADRAPSGVLEPIAGVLRSFEGRRVRACVDAAQAATVRGEALALSRPELGWVQWHEPTALETLLAPGSDAIELCYQSPFEASGAVRVRLVLRGSDGREITTYSPDTLTSLAGQGRCEPSDRVCCPTALEPDAPIADRTPAGEPGTAGGCTIALAPRARRALPPAKHMAYAVALMAVFTRRGRLALCCARLSAACLHRIPALARFAGALQPASAAPTTSSRRSRASS